MDTEPVQHQQEKEEMKRPRGDTTALGSPRAAEKKESQAGFNVCLETDEIDLICRLIEHYAGAIVSEDSLFTRVFGRAENNRQVARLRAIHQKVLVARGT
jgi:hypothetical protein